MPKKFIPHVFRGGRFVALKCEPVTSRQAAAMLETATELMIFSPVQQRRASDRPVEFEPEPQHVAR